MGKGLLRLIEPRTSLDGRRKIFSDAALMQIIIPLFFEQLLTMMVGIADTFMISYAGDVAVSGVSLVNMFISIFIYLFTALAAGGAVVVSQYIGSGKRENADSSAGQLLMSAAVISIVLMGATLIWNRQLLQFLFRRIEADVMDACVIYLRITALSFPALAVYNAGAALCRSTGRTDLTMKISVAANVINVAGNAVGIFLPRAGVAGVAYPTLIARIFSAVVITAVCFDRTQTVSYQWRNLFAWRSAMVRRAAERPAGGGRCPLHDVCRDCFHHCHSFCPVGHLGDLAGLGGDRRCGRDVLRLGGESCIVPASVSLRQVEKLSGYRMIGFGDLTRSKIPVWDCRPRNAA